MRNKKLKSIEKRYANYCMSTPKDRLNLLLANYIGFELVWTKLYNELVTEVYEQKQCNRRSNDDLGVKVQGGCAKSSPTENKAICIMEIEDAIMNCVFCTGLLNDVDNPEEIRRRVISLDLMKREYEVLSRRMEALSVQDRDILIMRMYYEKSVQEMADEAGLELNSISRKVGRIKHSLLDVLMKDLSKEVGMF